MKFNELTNSLNAFELKNKQTNRKTSCLDLHYRIIASSHPSPQLPTPHSPLPPYQSVTEYVQESIYKHCLVNSYPLEFYTKKSRLVSQKRMEIIFLEADGKQPPPQASRAMTER